MLIIAFIGGGIAALAAFFCWFIYKATGQLPWQRVFWFGDKK